jgi:hypothetical protein
MAELRALLCKGCGAPLPGTDDLQLQVTCRFCGVVNERTQAGVPLTHVEIQVHPEHGTAGGAGKAVAAIVIVVVLVIVGSVAWTVSSTISTARSVATAVGVATSEAGALARRGANNTGAKALLDRSELSSLGGNTGWRLVKVDAPPGGWSRVDPVAAAAWARDIAQPWSPDALLYRIDVKKVGDDGLVDLTSEDAEVGFRWVSPARIAAWEKEADLKGDVEGIYGLLMVVSKGEMRILVERGRPDVDRYPKRAAESIPMATLLSHARTGKGWVTRPFYQGYLIQLRDEGWVWYLNSLSGRDSLPRVRARDGRAWPYR